jgi:hypothetical protein
MLTMVGARDRKDRRVLVLRAFPKEQREQAKALYAALPGRFGLVDVDLLYGAYSTIDAFFRAEPEWDAGFPADADRTFAGPDGRGV